LVKTAIIYYLIIAKVLQDGVDLVIIDLKNHLRG
jgi:hypothetical protein